MSKFTDRFDRIESTPELKKNVHMRIRQDKGKEEAKKAGGKPGFGRIRKIALVTAAALMVIFAYPAFIAVNNAVANARYNFTKAIPVRSENKLTSLIQESVQDKSWNLNFGAPGLDAATSELAGGNKSSQTNVQVAGVDEGDLVKNDGNYIYRLSRTGFSIFRAGVDGSGKTNGQISRVCEVPIDNFSPIEMYVFEKQAVLIGGGYRAMPQYDIASLKDGGYAGCFYYHTNVEIRVFDLTEIEEPVQTRYFALEGNYHTSRIVESSGMLYFVVNYYNSYYYNNYDKADAQEKRPYIIEGEDGEPEALPLEEIFYFKNVPCQSYMMLGAIDLNDAEKDAGIRAYLSSAQITYVSGGNLYISTQQVFYDIFGNTDGSLSYLAKFSLSDLGFKGSNVVKGALKDRYCMDEYEGYLRAASSYVNWNIGSGSFASAVYVFDQNMKRISIIDNIAPGEAIDSAAFSGTTGIISTSVRFTMNDPIFIIDFTDVRNPKISEGLKEYGISSYLKLIEGSDYMLGLGFEDSLVKVQLYNMSGQEAVSVGRLTIGETGGYAYAEVLSNPKALLYMYDKDTMTGIFGFAAECSSYSNYGGYTYTIQQQGLFLFSFDAAAGTLKSEALLSNFGAGNVYQYSYSSGGNYDWQTMQDNYAKYVQRGVIIGDHIFTVGQNVITVYSLDGYVKTAQI